MQIYTRSRRTLVVGVIMAGGLVGCAPGSPAEQQEQNHAQSVAEEFADSAAAERERHRVVFEEVDPSERPFNVVAYDVQAAFDWSTARLDARVEIEFAEISADTETIVLDAAVAEVRRVFRSSTGDLLPFHYDRQGRLLAISLPPGGAGTVDSLRVGIDYAVDARRSRYLNAVDRRRGDPVQARALFTASEPRGARHWLPCNDRPNDRARFSFTFDLARHEKLVANGGLLQDTWEPSGERHRTTFQTNYTIPTYLAAFAVGEFSVFEETVDGLPVQLWARQGLRMDHQGVLKILIQILAHFETLMGAYPFEKYALVLLPEFPSGGIEHASVTFQAELRSSIDVSLGDVILSAHELGHQWFGDYVTIRDWDDLWIKEGMASLLGAEAKRFLPGADYAGGLMGNSFWIRAGDAIYAPHLPPERKYTSGPYYRGAWLLTQIRDWLGERDFWQFLRSLLDEFAEASISTADFLARLETTLGPTAVERVEQALVAESLPDFKVSRFDLDNGDAELTVEIADPEAAFLLPPTLRILDANGNQDVVLWPDESTTLYVPADGLLLFDPNDVHPALPHFAGAGSGDLATLLGDLLVPSDVQQSATFLSQSGHVHESALRLSQRSAWDLSPDHFLAYFDGLGSDAARLDLLRTGCALAQESDAGCDDDSLDWPAALAEAFARPPLAGVVGSTFLPECLELFADPETDPYALVWDSFRRDPSLRLWPDSVVRFLAAVPLAPARTLELWGPVVQQADSLRARKTAMERLNRQLTLHDDGQEIQAEMLPTWQATVRQVAATTDNADVVLLALAGMKATQDLEAIPLIAAVVRHPFPVASYRAVCAAKDVFGDAWQEHWTAFRELVGPPETLPEYTQDRLNDPSGCGVSVHG